MITSIKIISITGIIICLSALFILTFHQKIIVDFTKQYFIKRSAITANQASEYILTKGLKILRVIRIKKEIIQEIESNALECQENPEKYVEKIISQETNKPNGFIQKIKKLPEEIKIFVSIKTHFQNSVQKLVTDLYIFFITNLVGLSISAYFVFKKEIKGTNLIIPSFIIMFSIFYSATTYYNQNWFLNILLDSHMGIWYPLLVMASFVRYYQKYKDKELKAEALEDIAGIL